VKVGAACDYAEFRFLRDAIKKVDCQMLLTVAGAEVFRVPKAARFWKSDATSRSVCPPAWQITPTWFTRPHPS